MKTGLTILFLGAGLALFVWLARDLSSPTSEVGLAAEDAVYDPVHSASVMKRRAGSDHFGSASAAPVSIAHMGSKSSMPPVPVYYGGNTSLRTLFSKLSRAAEKGNAHAVKVLFHATMDCRNYLQAKQAADEELFWTTQSPRNHYIANDDFNPEKHAASLDRLNRFLGRTAALCDDVDESFLVKAIYNTTLNAARNGDQEGIACFVSGQFTDQPDFKKNPRLQAEYLAYARQFVSKGIHAGNWYVVGTMASVTGIPPTSRFSLRHQVAPYSNLAQFSWLSLMRLGANEQRAQYLDDELAVLRRTRHLSEQEVERAQRWAMDMYTRYFQGKPAYDTTPFACANVDLW